MKNITLPETVDVNSPVKKNDIDESDIQVQDSEEMIQFDEDIVEVNDEDSDDDNQSQVNA